MESARVPGRANLLLTIHPVGQVLRELIASEDGGIGLKTHKLSSKKRYTNKTKKMVRRYLGIAVVPVVLS